MSRWSPTWYKRYPGRVSSGAPGFFCPSSNRRGDGAGLARIQRDFVRGRTIDDPAHVDCTHARHGVHNQSLGPVFLLAGQVWVLDKKTRNHIRTAQFDLVGGCDLVAHLVRGTGEQNPLVAASSKRVILWLLKAATGVRFTMPSRKGRAKPMTSLEKVA